MLEHEDHIFCRLADVAKGFIHVAAGLAHIPHVQIRFLMGDCLVPVREFNTGQALDTSSFQHFLPNLPVHFPGGSFKIRAEDRKAPVAVAFNALHVAAVVGNKNEIGPIHGAFPGRDLSN